MNKRQRWKNIIKEIKSYHLEGGDILFITTKNKLSEKTYTRLVDNLKALLQKAGHENFPIGILETDLDVKVVKFPEEVRKNDNDERGPPTNCKIVEEKGLEVNSMLLTTSDGKHRNVRIDGIGKRPD